MWILTEQKWGFYHLTKTIVIQQEKIHRQFMVFVHWFVLIMPIPFHSNKQTEWILNRAKTASTHNVTHNINSCQFQRLCFDFVFRCRYRFLSECVLTTHGEKLTRYFCYCRKRFHQILIKEERFHNQNTWGWHNWKKDKKRGREWRYGVKNHKKMLVSFSFFARIELNELSTEYRLKPDQKSCRSAYVCVCVCGWMYECGESEKVKYAIKTRSL